MNFLLVMRTTASNDFLAAFPPDINAAEMLFVCPCSISTGKRELKSRNQILAMLGLLRSMLGLLLNPHLIHGQTRDYF